MVDGEHVPSMWRICKDSALSIATPTVSVPQGKAAKTLTAHYPIFATIKPDSGDYCPGSEAKSGEGCCFQRNRPLAHRLRCWPWEVMVASTTQKAVALATAVSLAKP